MKRIKPAVVLILISLLATVGAGLSVSSPQDAVADYGGAAVFRAEAAGATSAVWFDKNGNEMTGGVSTAPDGNVLRSSLSVAKVTDEIIENEYFCVFTDGKNCLVTEKCRVTCAPSLSRDDDYTSSTGIECHCAWLRAKLTGVTERDLLSGSGWYSYDADSGAYAPVSGDIFYVNGLSLGIGDVTPGVKYWYVYRAVTKTATVEQKFYVYESVPVSDNDIQTAHVLGDIAPADGNFPDSLRSGESEKYRVTDVSWTGKNTSSPTVTVTLETNEGFMFQFHDGEFKVRCGEYWLTAKSDGPLSARRSSMTVSGTFSVGSSETAELGFTAQMSGEDGTVSAEGYSSFSAYCLPAGMTVSQNGQIHYEGSGQAQCFIVARGNGRTAYGILSVSGTHQSQTETVRITTDSIPGAAVKTGYSFRLTCDRAEAVWSENGNVLSGIGLTLTVDGEITGVPQKTGTFTFSVTASLGGASDTKQFTVTVSKQKTGYKVTFVKNRGTGDMPAVTVDASIGKYTVPECSFTPPSNKKFVYWELDGKQVYPGQVLTITSDIKLKAIYETVEKDSGKTPGTDPHVHSFDAYEYNTRSHWLVCECGKTDGKEVHSFDENGTCTVCGYSKPGKTAQEETKPETAPPPVSGDGQTTREITVIGEEGHRVDVFVVIILIFICLCLAAAVIAFITAKKIR